MRLLIFESYHSVLYGNTRYLQVLLSTLNRSRFFPLLVTAGHGPVEAAAKVVGVDTVVVEPTAVMTQFGRSALKPRRLPSSVAGILVYWVRLIRLLKAWKPDIIFVTGLRSLLVIGVPAAVVRAPVCWLITVSFQHWLDLVGLMFARRVVFLSPTLRAQFHPHRPLGRSRDESVVSIGLTLPPPPAISLREELGLGRKAPVVGMAGMIIRAKGWHVFLDAAASVLREVPTAHFVLLGEARDPDDAYVHSLRLRCAQSDLAGHVTFLGWRADSRGVLAALDVYCLTSSAEGVPRSVLEAMAAGIPVVATDVGGTRDLVSNDVGILVPPGDAAAVARAIKFLLRHPEMAVEMGQRGAAHVRKHHSIDAHTRQLENILCEVATHG